MFSSLKMARRSNLLISFTLCTSPTKTRMSPAWMISSGLTGESSRLVADQLGQEQALQVAEFVGGDAFADMGGILQHPGFQEIIAAADLRRDLVRRQQPFGKKDDIDEAPKAEGNAHIGELENPQPLHPGFQRQAVDDQVGRRADQRDGTAQDGGVGKRQQQFGRGKMAIVFQRPQERGHDGGVVHEGREGKYAQAQAGQRSVQASGSQRPARLIQAVSGVFSITAAACMTRIRVTSAGLMNCASSSPADDHPGQEEHEQGGRE